MATKMVRIPVDQFTTLVLKWSTASKDYLEHN
jgi:hypothetical protein